MKVFISTTPFAQFNSLPIDLLNDNCIEYVINPLERKLTEDELCQIIVDFDVLIAGTENITKRVINSAAKLKLISRVGIGLDSVDLVAAKERGIAVSYTPDAPAPAVAELTIGLIFSLMRSTHIANLDMHNGDWYRHFGKRMCDLTVGIIGVGRIGGLVADYLSKLDFKKILVNDLSERHISRDLRCEFVTKDYIYANSDVITLHLPLNPATKSLIGEREMLSMKKDAMLINTSRGEIVDEDCLYAALSNGYFSGVAIDVFSKEPYRGPLSTIKRCLLTSHMGSMTLDCRARMEIEATEEALRFIKGESLRQLVPEYEYQAGILEG